jgi:hypothetical protein
MNARWISNGPHFKIYWRMIKLLKHLLILRVSKLAGQLRYRNNNRCMEISWIIYNGFIIVN